MLINLVSSRLGGNAAEGTRVAIAYGGCGPRPSTSRRLVEKVRASLERMHCDLLPSDLQRLHAHEPARLSDRLTGASAVAATDGGERAYEGERETALAKGARRRRRGRKVERRLRRAGGRVW
jgi:hypothetical protein